MTFQEFQATRQPCADLGAAVGDSAMAGTGGYLYCRVLFIEDVGTWPNAAQMLPLGRYYVLIGRAETQSDDLETVERVLYDFAVREGYTAE